MIILPDHKTYTQNNINRFLWWVEGWCNLIDGLCMILSIGFCCPLLAAKFINWRLSKALRDPFTLTLELSQDQLSRFRARTIARKIWKWKPKTTITTMSTHMAVQEVSRRLNGTYYSSRTIREWIKDLCPDRSPGRRPNA